MRVYVASSWRNEDQGQVVEMLKAHGFSVYDFKNPAPGNNGFSWKQVGGAHDSFYQYQEALKHPIAKRGFKYDMDALKECDLCVLVLPSGRSAHIEAGYAVGRGKPTIVYIPDGKFDEPELMYLMCDRIVATIEEVLRWASELRNPLTQLFGRE